MQKLKKATQLSWKNRLNNCSHRARSFPKARPLTSSTKTLLWCSIPRVAQEEEFPTCWGRGWGWLGSQLSLNVQLSHRPNHMSITLAYCVTPLIPWVKSSFSKGCCHLCVPYPLKIPTILVFWGYDKDWGHILKTLHSSQRISSQKILAKLILQ